MVRQSAGGRLAHLSCGTLSSVGINTCSKLVFQREIAANETRVAATPETVKTGGRRQSRSGSERCRQAVGNHRHGMHAEAGAKSSARYKTLTTAILSSRCAPAGRRNRLDPGRSQRDWKCCRVPPVRSRWTSVVTANIAGYKAVLLAIHYYPKFMHDDDLRRYEGGGAI